MKRTLAIVATTALVAGAAGGGIVAAAEGSGDAAAAGTAPSAVATTSNPGSPAETYRRDAPSVAVITAEETQSAQTSPFAPPSEQQVQSLGSGFVIDRKGDIVTNDHVVSGATNIRVGFGDSATYPARVVGGDPSSDLAVIRLANPPSGLRPLGFDDSSSIQPGDPVYAIGNPFGLDRTMTAGIVSATGRDIQAPNGLTIPDAIQTDAPINHGNSGGPLLDAAGHVIGVTSQIQGGTVDANVGIGFAVPSNTARSVAQQLIDHGQASHPWLGVALAAVNPSTAAGGQAPSGGALVTKVTAGGPAAKAGLVAAQAPQGTGEAPQGGDVIVAVDGTTVASPADLAGAVAGREPGDHITLRVLRDGHTRDVAVVVGNAPAAAS